VLPFARVPSATSGCPTAEPSSRRSDATSAPSREPPALTTIVLGLLHGLEQQLGWNHPILVGDDEQALRAIATRAAEAIVALDSRHRSAGRLWLSPVAPTASAVRTPTLRVRHFTRDDTILLGHDYLIKGVAGAILAKLLREYQETQRVDFTNRELRLDPALKLPEYRDNFETRLVMLRRRLVERSPHLQIERAGRGRFGLLVDAPLHLEEVS